MRPAAVLVACLLAAAGGCGGSDPPSDRDQVRTTIADYVAATGGDDPERVCDLLVDSRSRLPPERCSARVGDGRLRSPGRVRVRAVRVRGPRAVAALEGGERVRLRRVDDAWRIVVPG